MSIHAEIHDIINKYGEDSFMNAVNSLKENKEETERRKNWNLLCHRFGFNEDDFNRSFVSPVNNRDVYVLKELKPRNRKYPVIAERSDGKMFKLPLEMVLKAIRNTI